MGRDLWRPIRRVAWVKLKGDGKVESYIHITSLIRLEHLAIAHLAESVEARSRP